MSSGNKKIIEDCENGERMSEELKQKNYTKKGDSFGEYDIYTLGATSINGLKKFKIIPQKEYGKNGNKKPDQLIVDRRNKSLIRVITVIEYKDSLEFNTIEYKKKAIEQVNTYAQVLDAPISIVTDTNEYIWINSKVKKEFAEEIYKDDFGVERWYSRLINEDGYNLSYNFVRDLSNTTELNKNLNLIKRILIETSDNNSQLNIQKRINPKNLAKKVWQSIWLASGENPDKCLSTFVEIFIFRYLSDLDILKRNISGVPVDFNSVIKIEKDICLKYYFNNVREHIKKLFPLDSFDNTSIINGFILDPNIKEHNHLFMNVLKDFSEFLKDIDGNEIKLINIEPEFKSRLYEDFLKRSISQKNWGQYFTPRNVVKSMIEISGIEKLQPGATISDPACGVGGFILEPLLTKRTSDYFMVNGELKCKINYEGLDRDPKVIIMAKSNMLIYLSELLKDNPTLTSEFSKKINETFKSYHSSILGSLSVAGNEKSDLIMSNPPYVTKGIINYKDAIENNGELKEYYKVNGMGVESLFLEKMIYELKPKGTAIVIIPDGILNRVHDNKIREFIKKKCEINAIISLPIGTFYSTQKKTYIISLTKKDDESQPQTSPIFSYIISSIGESLDVYRVFIKKNDLIDMAKQYKYFMTDKFIFEPLNSRCKLLSIDDFIPKNNWCVDRMWSHEEKIALGIEEEINIVDIDEFHNQITKIMEEIKILNNELNEINRSISTIRADTTTEFIKDIFDIKQGDAYYTLKIIKENGWEGEIPIYSSNTKNNGLLVKIQKDKIKTKDMFYDYCLTWAIDGMAGELFIRNELNINNLKDDKFLFTVNNHCGVLIPKEKIEFYAHWLIKEKFINYSAKIFSEELQRIYTQIGETHVKEKIEKFVHKILKDEGEIKWEGIEENVQSFNPELHSIFYDEILPIVKKHSNNRIKLDLRYIKTNIQPLFHQKTRSYGNKKLGNNQIEDIEVILPISSEGLFQIEIMKKIADEQEKLYKIKSEIMKKYEIIRDMEVVFQ